MNVSSKLYLYLPYASNAEEQFQHNFGDDGGAAVLTPDRSVWTGLEHHYVEYDF